MKTLDTKLKDNYRRRHSTSLKGKPRVKKAHELLGCGLRHFKKHISSQFLDGMTWDNYGQWHIDHKIPLMNFDMTKLSEQRKAFHYKNTRPLWAMDNYKRKKKMKILQEYYEK